VTFDTGGISIKPADGMERMKDDMAGGAAVICAMRAIARLQAPIRVIGVVPATENMPGGRAMKPGDVLTAASGKTVEVVNTDAEGRLILGDALWYAQSLGATHLVDVATLTGACVVALGRAAAAIFGQPESWTDLVRRTALAAGDRCWPMPLYEEYTEQLKSEIADLINSGGRPAGACTAAAFLKEFASTCRGPTSTSRHRLGRGLEALAAQGGDRSSGPHAGRAGLRGPFRLPAGSNRRLKAEG
jgi:leucyl aminopeptidase